LSKLALVKVAAVQHDILWRDAKANFARLAGMIHGAAGVGAKLIALPEHFGTGGRIVPGGTEPDDGPTVAFLRETSAANGAWICGSIATQIGDTIATTLLLVGPDGTIHRSLQPPPGGPVDAPAVPATYEIEDLRVTPIAGSALYDPSVFWDVAVDTDVFVVCGNEPESRRHAWRTLLAARAIENECYVVGVNRVGSEGNQAYVGDSRIVDPQGALLTAGWGAETVLFAELESALVRFTRNRSPLIENDRRGAVIKLP
jgi:predicted amidohydrolase